MKLSLLLAVAGLPVLSSASTVLFSHVGSTNPTSQGWSRTTTTTVVGEAYNDNGREVWRVYDPGYASGGTNLSYSATLNASLLGSVMEAGWELSSTLSVPVDDPADTIARAAGSNIWVGFIANESGGGRRIWALMFGRTDTGETLVSTYGGGSSLTLDPGYHSYSIQYDPITTLATVRIDGEVWKTYSGATLAGSGSNQVYWGDNSGQTTVVPPRSAYYESVTFSIAPEPGRALLLGLGALVATCRRRRHRHRDA